MFAGIVLRALAIWLVILFMAIANGLLREFILLPAFGNPFSLVISGLLLCALIIVLAYLSLPWLKINRSGQLWAVGLGWLALTLVFEFSFGIMQGKSFSELLEAYTLRGGNLWVVVLATTALAPYLAAKLRGIG